MLVETNYLRQDLQIKIIKMLALKHIANERLIVKVKNLKFQIIRENQII